MKHFQYFGRRYLLVVLFVMLMPTALLVAPRPAAACTPATPCDFINLVQNTISAVADPTSAASTYWTMLKGSVLDPLAHALAQAVLKSITASVVNSINGTNGSPQFVTNLSANLQQVGDIVALSFISQFTSSIVSPFTNAIGGALRSSYLQGSSLAGYFAANQCTLNQASPNINGFLSGNFQQGGWQAWFALTTQQQNNPFTIYALAKGQLASLATAAQTNQRQTISQNGGFLSWCGSYNPDTAALLSQPLTSMSGTLNTSIPTINADGSVSSGASQTTNVTINAPTAQAQPGPNCLNSDGTPGTVQTPGSVIHDTLSKALGSGVDSLVSVHDFDQMVDTILSALVTKVVSTGLSALSGSDSSSSFNGQPSGATGSTDPNANSVASQANSLAQTSLTQVSNYTTAWQTIQSAAQQASSTVTGLAGACSGLANQAQTALTNEIQPVLSQAQQAFTSAAATQALARRVQIESNGYSSGEAGAGGSLTSDTQTLAAAPPTVTDVATAQSGAQKTDAATSTSPYTLTVSGGTLVDQMNLITQNAQAMRPFCGPPLPVQ